MSYNCDRAQENISAYVDGELGTIESIRLKLHTLKCKKCREDLNFEKDLVRTMSSENFFLPHDFSESLHRKLETEYTKNPVKREISAEFENTLPRLSSKIFTWLNEKKLYVSACACIAVFVFALSAYQLGGNENISYEETTQTQTTYYPKGMARVADMSDITDDNISSQKIEGANQNVFDKFRNKYMTKKFVANFNVVNDTVGYSTTQDRGITSIMRTIKDVVTDAVSGKKGNASSLPKVNTSIKAIAYVNPASASSKVAVDLRDKVPASVDDESMYGVLMINKNLSKPSVASAENYDIRKNSNEKEAYNPESDKIAFSYSDVFDYSGYTPSSLSVKTSTFTADIANFTAIKNVLSEYKYSMELQETDSNITISVDSVNYDVIVSRLKMSNLCTFNQTQGRDYTKSYNNLVKKQSGFMNDPSKYNDLIQITEEIEKLISKLGKNTIKINFE